MSIAVTMISMECDNCRARWECAEKQPDDKCPDCAATAIHRTVSDLAVIRMSGLLGTKKTTPERLKTAFTACTTGGEAYAEAVLARAVELGYIELVNDTVWRADREVR